MDTNTIKLMLYEGTYWKDISENNSYPAYFLEISNGQAYVRDRHGFIAPPSAIKELIPLLQDYIDNNTEEKILTYNLSSLKKEEERPERPNKTLKPGFIYAIRCGNKLKIGRTKNLESRFKNYKKVSDIFSIIATIKVEDYIKAEKTTLEHFGGTVTQHEWFDHSPEIEAKVLDYFNNKLVLEITS